MTSRSSRVGVGEPAGADPGLEIAGEGKAGEGGVGLQIMRGFAGEVGLEVTVATAWNPELAEGEVAGGVGDVEPVAHLDDAGILDSGAVKALDAGAEDGLVGCALEVVAIGAGGQAEVALVVEVRLGGAVEEDHLPLVLVIPGGGVEDGEVFPGVPGVRREDGITLEALEFHG